MWHLPILASVEMSWSPVQRQSVLTLSSPRGHAGHLVSYLLCYDSCVCFCNRFICDLSPFTFTSSFSSKFHPLVGSYEMLTCSPGLHWDCDKLNPCVSSTVTHAATSTLKLTHGIWGWESCESSRAHHGQSPLLLDPKPIAGSVASSSPLLRARVTLPHLTVPKFTFISNSEGYF